MSDDGKDGGPAFPSDTRGMTLRDWFAGQALIGIIGLRRYTADEEGELAEAAYVIADAMLEQKGEIA